MLAATTKSANDGTFFLVTNQDSQREKSITVDLGALVMQGKGTVWQFDATHADEVVGDTIVQNGKMTLTVPVMGALLVKLGYLSV